MDFAFNHGQDSGKADLYVVKNQNEGIILGMNWIYEEDIVLQVKQKSVTKTAKINAAEDFVTMMLKDYVILFEITDLQTLTNAPYKHVIETGSALPVVSRDYRKSQVEEEAIRQEVKTMLRKKVIKPSNSSWLSPVVLIKKPDNSYRFCVDYRKLNQVTVRDNFPLPLITGLLDRLSGNKIFTTLDLKSGYWQLPLDEASAEKTAFIANGELYEFNFLPFGVMNGPASFSRLMNIVLKGIKSCMCYIDDIIIFSASVEDHIQDVKIVLDRLLQYNLRLSKGKCKWFCQEVAFLGFLVNDSGIRSNPEKTKVVTQWQAPKDKKALMRFLGFATFYHRFIRNLADKAKPLYLLLKKDVKYTWTASANKAFEEIKQEITRLPTLAYPDSRLPYDLHCDASDVGLDACLVQQGRPIAFASRTLNTAERNYSTTEKECLCLVWSIHHFHAYTYGAVLTVYTNHASLRAILSTKMPRGRIARWIMTLQEYQPMNVVHRKGVDNKDADALSRLESNSQDPSTLDAKSFLMLQQADPYIKMLLQQGIQAPFKWKQNMVCYQEGDTLIPVVPKALVQTVLAKAHDDITGGHFGEDKTMGKVKQMGWWATRKEDVTNWVRHCQACQIYKVRNNSQVAPMKQILPTYFGEIWAANIAILPTSTSGKKYILVLMEYLSKWAVTAALSSFESESVIQVLLYEVVLKIGLPHRLITNNGRNFISEAMNAVCTRLGINRSLTSVEHPQSDGLVERMNRTLKTGLSIAVGEDPGSWDTALPFVTFAYNTSKHASTGFSPFELLYGRKMVLPLLPTLEILKPKTYTTEAWMRYLNAHVPLLHKEALQNIAKSQAYQKKAQDKKTSMKIEQYLPGDTVARKTVGLIKFPKQRWSGPWLVIKKANDEGTAYQIKKDKVTSIVNVELLRPWYTSLRGRDDVIQDKQKTT